MNALKNAAIAAMMTLSTIAYGQMGKGKVNEIEDIQRRKLIVIVEEPRERVIKKLTKKKKEAELENYKAALNEYNTMMKEVVEKHWPYKEKGIEYKTLSEVKALNKAKNTKYAVLFCQSKIPSSISSAQHEVGLNWTWSLKDDSDDRDYRDYFTSMEINRIEDFEKVPVYETPLPDIFPTKASLVFGINAINIYFEYRIRKKKQGEKINQKEMMEEKMKENAGKLKDMTLLLREDWLHKDLTASSVKNCYKYNYKVCTKEEMDNAIMNQQEQTAYVIILPYVTTSGNSSSSNMIVYIHYIYDAKTSDLMAYIMPGYGSLIAGGYASQFGVGTSTGKRTIEKKNLEKFSEIIGK